MLFYPCQIKAQAAFIAMKDTVGFKLKIGEMAKITLTTESDFVQEKSLSVLSEKIISKGHFLFKKENQLRWEYTDPFPYTIVINKDKVTIKDDEKISHYDMNSNKVFKRINDIMINSVQGNITNNKDYRIVFLENIQFFLVEMTPLKKEGKDFLKTINLYFERDGYYVSKVKLIENSGDYTLIEFVNHKKNESIPDTRFTLH